ncbi:hypothetical protein [Staphylococcus phage APTC_SA_12]|nr:MAG: hypothetical protein [Staphylococcus phage RP2]UPO38616.1 hypothetical protein [Staphylococcus phage vB_SaS_GE1]UWV19985.1 hypothetical protein [Staphylococcus phage APTC_SA_2]UWV20141.1 hypothetical protein [Staphylococcus phage APTC_SA_4]UWV20312.1 hypothetical protein [Staphylococcus phage APTC_SA_12]UWV20569.1 hypothetical protein [Staphylococcus phage APTC_SA_13]WMT38686.1 hypothetical protein [Staphylococcus phage Sp2021]WPH66982.1 hypothetical protein CUBB_gp66 [Staphylococcus
MLYPNLTLMYSRFLYKLEATIITTHNNYILSERR